jgi:hypothetical protein
MRGAIGVLSSPGQQPQPLGRSVGEPYCHPGLLGADGPDQRGVGEREAATVPVGLVVVVEKNRPVVLVDLEALQVQARDLADPPAGACTTTADTARQSPGSVGASTKTPSA